MHFVQKNKGYKIHRIRSTIFASVIVSLACNIISFSFSHAINALSFCFACQIRYTYTWEITLFFLCVNSLLGT